MARLARILGLSAIGFGIAACSSDDRRTDTNGTSGAQSFDFSSVVGTTKTAPDEFAVQTVKPLQLPKDFTALPPPTPGTRSPLQADPIADARQILLGEAPAQPANARVSASESALLASTNSGAADPSIRAVLEAEQTALEESQPSYALENIIPSIRRDPNAGEALTASEERERLSEVLPAREFGKTEVATIPNLAAPSTAGPNVAPPTVSAAPAKILPVTEPATGGELIFIPE